MEGSANEGRIKANDGCIILEVCVCGGGGCVWGVMGGWGICG